MRNMILRRLDFGPGSSSVSILVGVLSMVFILVVVVVLAVEMLGQGESARDEGGRCWRDLIDSMRAQISRNVPLYETRLW